MTDYIDVVEHNPIVFVKQIIRALEEGYNVQNTIAGYPMFGVYNQVRLFKQPFVGATSIAEDHDGLVQHYDPMAFVLLLQSFVEAGYKFKEDGNHFFDELGLKSVQLEKPKTEKAEELKQVEVEKPAKRANKKPLKAEPTKSELEGE